MPSGFMPNGTVENHGSAASFASQWTVEAMNASMVPFEAASKVSSVGMIWPADETSIWNRPPLVSSTTLASRRAEPWSTSSAGVHVVGILHLIFGCAMTWGAPTMVAAVAAATTAPAFAMNRRLSVIESASPFHKLVVGAFGDVVPRTHQGLELLVRGVHPPGHGCLLRLLLHHFSRELLEVPQHRRRELH